MPALINDATTALLRAIRLAFDDAEAIAFEEIRSRSWASATFAGARHQLTFRIECDRAEAAAAQFAATLDTAEFALRGYFLADVALVSRTQLSCRDVRIAIEALTVEDS